MPKKHNKVPWTHWSFTTKTLPRPVYEIVTHTKLTHTLTNWQVVILALYSLQRLERDYPTQALDAIEWVKRTYPDGKAGGGPWSDPQS